MKNKFLFIITLTGICLALTACRKHTETSAEKAQRQMFSKPSIENNYKPDEIYLLEGDWKGALQIQKTKLRLALHIKQADGSFSATLDSIDQGAKDIPANAIQFVPPKVKIQWQGIGGIFDGTFGNGKLSGTWRQGAAEIPLVFERD